MRADTHRCTPAYTHNATREYRARSLKDALRANQPQGPFASGEMQELSPRLAATPRGLRRPRGTVVAIPAHEGPPAEPAIQ